MVNQGSNNVQVLPGLGGGFFDDRSPTGFAADNSPSRAFVGQFDSGPGLDLVIVNTQSNDLTYYSNFMATGAKAATIPSGGQYPIAALQGDFNDDGYSDLIVANNGDGTIALFEGSPSGLVFTNSVTLPGSTHPTDIVFEGGTTGQLRLFVAAQGQSSLIAVNISFLPTIATPSSSEGSTILSGRTQTTGPAGNLGTSSLELASGTSSEVSSLASASGASSGVSGLSVTTTGIGTAAVMQSLTSLTGGSFSSLVSMLLEIDATHVTEVQPLRNGEVAAVAVMLTVQEFRVDRLDEQLRSDVEKDQEAGPPVMTSLELRSRDRVDARSAPDRTVRLWS